MGIKAKRLNLGQKVAKKSRFCIRFLGVIRLGFDVNVPNINLLLSHPASMKIEC